MNQADRSSFPIKTDSQDPGPGVRAGRASAASGREQAPIWLAALEAARCRALAHGLHHEVHWMALAGRALYTNYGHAAEWIEPLDVVLPAGSTLAVHWAPGETEFTLEVYADTEKCA